MSMRAFTLLSTRTKATYLRSYGSTSLHRDHLCSGISLLPRFCSFSTSDVRRRCVSPHRHMPRMPICPLARDFCEISYWYTSNRYRPLPRSSRARAWCRQIAEQPHFLFFCLLPSVMEARTNEIKGAMKLFLFSVNGFKGVLLSQCDCSSMRSRRFLEKDWFKYNKVGLSQSQL